MTTPLFPDASTIDQEPVERVDVDERDTQAPVGRWSLHRAGILGVWQYDRVELRFAGGRLLLRGKNGAGKSKALEVLLPFLLDGDTRRLDATGRDRTTVKWLMTDQRPDGHHVGYVWLELRCVDDDDEVRFQTLGAGLKASTSTGKADSWFFITTRRVGVDVHLDVAGECLSIEKLKDTLGEDAVTASGAEHRRRVARRVFGLSDEARYENLLHLLHRLRDPNIGNRVDAGELADVLSDALPPVDDRILVEAAGHFDDLDTIRDQVDRSARMAKALGEFLGTYRGYSRTVLVARASAVIDADRGRVAAGRATARLARATVDAQAALTAAESRLDELRQERNKREAECRELERSEAYRAHQELVDRDGRVQALEVAADTARRAAARARDAHDRATADLDAAAADRQQSLDAVLTNAVVAAGHARDAGVEVGDAIGRPDPDDPTPTIERGAAARNLAELHRERARHLRSLLQQADQAGLAAAGAEERASLSEAEVDEQRGVVRATRVGVDAAELAWADAVNAWTTTATPASVDVDWNALVRCLALREGEPSWTAAVHHAVHEALTPAKDSARRAAAEADAEVARAEEALDHARARLAELEDETEARPERSRFCDVERDPAAGTPLYELVDFAPHVDVAAAAGLEAALEASGLLDAWVHAAGLVVHPDTHDVIVRADSPHTPAGAPTLADLLVPAVVEGGAVSLHTVANVLRGIGLGDRSEASTWVSTDGRWSVGALRGAWRKQQVEFVGAGARRATRERLVAEARSKVAGSEAELTEARTVAGAAADRRDRLEALLQSVPPTGAIDDAGLALDAAERGLAAAQARFDIDRRRAEEARANANRLAADADHAALTDGLPGDLERLDVVLSALAELRQALLDHDRHLRDLVRSNGRFRRARGDVSDRRGEADSAATEAARRRQEHDTAAHELAVLRAAIASTVESVLAQHAAATARRSALDDELVPSAQRAQVDAATEHARVEARREAAVQAEDAAVRELTEAADRLASAVGLPGLVLSATGREIDDHRVAHTDGMPSVGLATTLLPLVDGDDEVSDGTVLSRYDRLSDALAGGFDAEIDEIDGVKVVHVTDDSGRQALAVVAARVAADADAAKSRLAARERDVLERFLLRELADELRSKVLDAHDLVAGANRTLANVRTSHGKGASLRWEIREDASGPASIAMGLLIDNLRDEVADAQLRDALLGLIDAERTADPSAGYEQHLRAALDYRTWHRFTVKVTDSAHPGSARTLSTRLGLSQGEQRVLSYLALFAAAAAHFEAIGRETPSAPRLLLLDDAFAKVDEPTHGQLLGLLVDLGLDFVLTSERMWGCFPSVPSIEIYEAVRDPTHPGVALVHFRWDGRQRHLVGV